MFNYLSVQEHVFLETHQNIFSQRIFRNNHFANLIENLHFYTQYLSIPFSPISFSSEVLDIYIDNWIDDVFYLASPFFVLFTLLSQEKHDFLEWVCGVILSCLLIAAAIIDLTAQMTMFSLGLLTRSLATVAYGAYFYISHQFGSDNEKCHTSSCSILG